MSFGTGFTVFQAAARKRNRLLEGKLRAAYQVLLPVRMKFDEARHPDHEVPVFVRVGLGVLEPVYGIFRVQGRRPVLSRLGAYDHFPWSILTGMFSQIFLRFLARFRMPVISGLSR
jgi:hypothetical protein